MTKIALVRKGYRPVNDGARISVVKAEEATLPEKVADMTLMERIRKALGLGSESVEKSESEQPDVEIVALEKGTKDEIDAVVKAFVEKASANGEHAPMQGAHAHRHPSHLAVIYHSHEHTHADDNVHSHSHSAMTAEGSQGAGDGTEITKAEGEQAPNAETPPADDTAEDVAKAGKADADAAADKRVDAMIAKLESVVSELKAAQERDDKIEKAMLTAESVGALVDEKIGAVVKAIEDLGIERARAPKTPNVTTAIEPKPTTTVVPDVSQMTYADAVRALLNG